MVGRRRFLAASMLGLGTFAGMVPAARGQVIGKPVRILLGFPAGGTADILARSLAEKLRGRYASAVIVENRPGARGAVVVNAVMSSEPDGSVFCLAPHSMTTLWPQVYRNLAFDPMRDLVPVASIATLEFAFAVGPNVPATSIAEFVQWCKANPKRALFGTTGTGGTPHFLGVLLGQAAGIELTPVPYAGAPQGVQALLSGELPSWIGPLGDIAPHHRSGKVRVIATSGVQRNRFLQQVPTFTEAGYPAIVAQERWGVYLRAGASVSTVQTLNKAVLAALEHADFRATVENLSWEPSGSSPQEFEAISRSEHERWRGIVKASGFTPVD